MRLGVVLFAPLNPACATPNSFVDEFQASFWPAAAPQAVPGRAKFGCQGEKEG